MSGRLIRVRGLVQGVGFRPYVWRLANELGLNGWVRNDGAGVTLAVDGEKLAEFIARLPKEKPPLARIDEIVAEPFEVGETGFSIRDSVAGAVATAIGPDAAICADCVAEMFDPANRRWRYAFTTCTHCGPRYTVSRRVPYDRAQTSLAPFPLCPACAAEYIAPVDRRFHAETTCCPACGPRLQLLDASGAPVDGDPLAETLRLLQAGKIVALKGLGGFHLACDARNADAVAELRRRKQREAKPFAVMALNPASLAAFAVVGESERALMQSAAAPIVLCPKTADELPGIAPGLPSLGVMLPATPLHLLLWHEAAGRPAGTDWLINPANIDPFSLRLSKGALQEGFDRLSPNGSRELDGQFNHEASQLLLVMTSANPHGEPLVTGNAEALERLVGIADAFLLHDRDVVVRCDDSLLRSTPDGPAFVRRARGYVPVPIALPKGGPSVLALGGFLKNTVCVLKGKEAFLSQHVGGLDNAAAVGFLEETVRHLLAILDVRPDLIAHDLHPDFPSTHLALRLADEFGVPAFAIAHHQAHLAAICAEHGLKEPVIGLALDGVGLGPDGGLWGGELLRLDGARCERLGHLQTLKLPGGDRAAREPWRMAVSALHAGGLAHCIGSWLPRHFPDRDAGPLLTMLARDLHCPPTSSLGRWFDAVAGILGVREVAQYEGQAAMELEGLALRHGPVEPLAGGYVLRDGGLDLRPLLPALLACDEPAYGAALFHATLAAGLAKWLLAAVDRGNPGKIVVGGGCAMNGVLMTALRHHLEDAGLSLLEARQAPPNDGGLALGQAWLARRMFKESKDVSGHSGPSG